ncbi:MAG: hypothetical protein V4515_06825 [Chloroflexota bacterium]
MSHQRSTPLNALYHRQLGDLIKRDLGVRLRPRIVRGFELDHVSRLQRLLEGPPIDGVLVHLREATIVAAARAFVNESIDGKTRRRLNRAMFHRTHRPTIEARISDGGPATRSGARGPDAYRDGDDDLQDLPLPGLRIAGVRIRNINYMLGVMTGLGGWAIQDELNRFHDLARVCRARGIPLFVLGPTPATYSFWAGLITRRANGRIRRHASQLEVPCALVEEATDRTGRPLTRGDGFHLTIEGHRFIAEQLYEQGMPGWVSSILAVKDLQQSSAATMMPGTVPLETRKPMGFVDPTSPP